MTAPAPLRDGLLIAVDGPSGVGKSNLCTNLTALLRAAVPPRGHLALCGLVRPCAALSGQQMTPDACTHPVVRFFVGDRSSSHSSLALAPTLVPHGTGSARVGSHSEDSSQPVSP